MKTFIRLFVVSILMVGLVMTMPTIASAFNPDSGVNTHAGVTTGWYDHQQIWYDKATVYQNAQAAANLIKQGAMVFHVVNPDGTVPVYQTTFPTPPTGGVATDGNVLSAIPTEVGYTGGAWDLQIFHWNAPATRALTKDDDIHGAAAAGEGWIEVTDIVVRCPLIDFSNLR
ncbi:MAG TPA: hypothetical protein VEM34_06190 [Burkholderiales bacterium]|nr:hypothetical protein [Burkholderiales bacterium]